jgi:glycerophosphoryl diester phosphodiesterase
LRAASRLISTVMRETTYFSGPRPRIFAHRGASGVAPENTLAAFRLGIAAGATHLEMDVHATRDGRIVVLHDPTLDRTTDLRGAVKELDWAAVKEADAGARFVDPSGAAPFSARGVRIPLLGEVLAAFPDVPLNIEVKQAGPAIVSEVVALLDRARASSRVLLAAESQAVMNEIRQQYQGPTGFSADEVVEFYQRSLEDRMHGYRPPGAALQVPLSHEGIEVVSRKFVDDAHRVRVEVHVWTLNDADEIRGVLQLGADGIMSDFPALAAEVIAGA